MPRLSALAFCLDNYGFVRHGKFGWNVQIFTGTDSWICPPGVTEVEYLVVAGGGAGGYSSSGINGGGGGGGGVLSGTLAVTPGTSYAIAVGAGGTASPSSAGSGQNSSFTPAIVASGGGYGGYASGPAGTAGGSGGSGGGGVGGTASQPYGTGTAGQGNNGGTGSTSSPDFSAGGGGGVTTVGFDGADSGRGGAGLFSTVSGRSLTYGGGGGGGHSAPGTGGVGGAGGGGSGSVNPASGEAGLARRGGGGGGAGNNPSGGAAGGSGGSGVVVLRYRQPGATVTKFTSTTLWRCPQNVSRVEFLAIGGGGAGGVCGGFGSGGGGGAGMLSYYSDYDRIEPGKLYVISVQAGGAGLVRGLVDSFGGGGALEHCLSSAEESPSFTPAGGGGKEVIIQGLGGQGSSNQPAVSGSYLGGGYIENLRDTQTVYGGSSSGGSGGRLRNSFAAADYIAPDGPNITPNVTPGYVDILKSPQFPGTTGYGGGAGYTTSNYWNPYSPFVPGLTVGGGVGGSAPTLPPGGVPHGNKPAVGDYPFQPAISPDPTGYADIGGGGGGGAGGTGYSSYGQYDTGTNNHTDVTVYGGQGGIGFTTTITGTPLKIGGGGGGGGGWGGHFFPSVVDYGDDYGGGTGGSYIWPGGTFWDGTNGAANTGSGGGGGTRGYLGHPLYASAPPVWGSATGATGNGGSGVVIIRTYGI